MALEVLCLTAISFDGLSKVTVGRKPKSVLEAHERKERWSREKAWKQGV
jgi:hypothetical protein